MALFCSGIDGGGIEYGLVAIAAGAVVAATCIGDLFVKKGSDITAY